MITNAQALLQRLKDRGLVAADVVEPAGTVAVASHDRPWYISALLGASGWIAGFFLLGFVAILFHPNDAASAAIGGVFLLAAAWGLFKADREGAFVAQLALALSIAGQCLVVFAMTEHSRGIAPIASAALVLQVALALLMPNALHRILSTFFATIAWALTVRFVLIGEPDFWHSAHDIALPLSSALAGWLLAWLPIGAGLWMLIRREAQWMSRGWQTVVRPVLTGLIVGLAFATVASQPVESFRWLGDGDAAVGWLAVWPLLSAFGALGAVAAAFALRSRALMGVGAVGVLLHVAHFYYELGTSLLIKSLLMLAMGAAMLLAARLLKKHGART